MVNTIKGRKTKLSSSKKRRKRRTKAEKSANWISYKLARTQATPKWADLEAIEKIYAECRALNKKARRKHYQVDHIIPLRGKAVCGLHVETNLKIITKKENRSKSNKFNPDDHS